MTISRGNLILNTFVLKFQIVFKETKVGCFNYEDMMQSVFIIIINFF